MASALLLAGLAVWVVSAAPAAMVLVLAPTVFGTVETSDTALRVVTGPLPLILVLVAEPVAVHRLLLRRRALPLVLSTAAACAVLALVVPALARSGA